MAKKSSSRRSASRKEPPADERTEDTAAEIDRVEETPEEESAEDRLLRLRADFDNFRKRTERERGTWRRQANESLLADLLPALDHFEMGLRTAEQHHAESAVLEGFRLVYDQLQQALARHGLEPIDAEGQPFDPHRHEAISHLPSEEHPADMVIAQTRRGYLHEHTLLRPAQVVVSSGPPEDTDS